MTESVKRVDFFKSIKLRAWLGIFSITIIPLFLFGVYAFDAIGNVSRDVLIESNVQAFQQVKYEVDEYVSNFDELIRYLATDERFKKADQFNSAVETMRHLDQSYESIEKILWVDSKGNLKAHSKRDSNSVTKMSFAEDALAKSNQSYMFAPEAFLVKAKISDAVDSDAIVATISFLRLRKSLEGLTFGTKFRYFLVTETGENILDQSDFPRETIADLMGKPCGAYDLLPLTDNGSPQIAISLPILHYGLRIIVFQDSGEVYEIARSLGKKIFNFILLLCLISFIFAIYLSWSITAPVADVAEKAILLSEGEKDVTVEVKRNDELGFLAKCFNSMSSNITRRMTEINALYKVTNYINNSSTSRKALDLCLEHIIDIFYAKRGSIMLLNEEKTALVVESFKLAKTDEQKSDSSNESHINDNKDESIEEENISPVHFELKIGEGIAGKVAATGEPILCEDCYTDERFKDYSNDKSRSPKTLVSVPLSVHNKIIGVVNLSDRSNSKPFTDSDLSLLTAIANQMAMSIDNARLHDLSVINEQTDLYVRKYLDIRLDDEIKRSKRYDIPLTVALFSIDGFAELNTKYGNNACESALYEIGRLLKKTIRATDIPAEYDCNKLCVVLSHTTQEQAKLFADRFLLIASEYEIKRTKTPFKITLSVGLCQYSNDKNYSYNDLLIRSDKALIESRKKGNITTIYADSEEQDK